jgi:hypothetical protein
MARILRFALYASVLILLLTSCVGQGRKVKPVDEQPNGVAETGGTEGRISTGGTETGVTGTEGNGLPQGWPEDIPTMVGFEAATSTRNTSDGMVAVFKGSAQMGDVESFYRDAMKNWESIPSPPIQQQGAGPRVAMYCFAQGDRTAWIGFSDTGQGGAVQQISIFYNWFTRPGVFPKGWPDDIPVMPGLDVAYGSINERGAISVNLTGNKSLEDVADYYKRSLTGWTRVDPQGMPEIQEGNLVMTFERNGKKLAVAGNSMGGVMSIALILNDIGPG